MHNYLHIHTTRNGDEEFLEKDSVFHTAAANDDDDNDAVGVVLMLLLQLLLSLETFLSLRRSCRCFCFVWFVCVWPDPIHSVRNLTSEQFFPIDVFARDCEWRRKHGNAEACCSDSNSDSNFSPTASSPRSISSTIFLSLSLRLTNLEQMFPNKT